MTTDERLAALEAKMDALTAPPSDYYTSRYSGEEIDAAIAACGNPLILKKIYASVSAMNNDVSGEVATGEFAGIAPEDTADADYGKVYVKGASGWVYWATLKTIDGIKGPQGPAGPAGAKGADGAAGPTGPAGPANTLSVGTVTKGDEARAEITGTAPKQTLNLVLPKGDKGDRGEKGSDGVDGSKGDPGDAGPANVLTIGTVEKGDAASATITGTSPAQVLNLVLPKGDRGDPGPEGPQGPKGDQATVNGISPDASGNIALTAGDVNAYSKTETNTLLQNKIDASSGAGAHNAIYRGKNLGSAVTAEQYAAIQAGTFDDLYIGDYWTIGGVNYRIAAFDYYYRSGYNIDITTHHVTLVPDTALYSHVMNDTNTTDGGYIGSKMKTSGLDQAVTTINNAFGSAHILTRHELFTNAVSNGKPSGGSWYDSTVDLMTEQNVYGSRFFAPAPDGTTIPYQYEVDKSQYPLFAFRPDLISNRTWYWLRDVVSAAGFASVADTGNAAYNLASDASGVRPAFSIKA